MPTPEIPVVDFASPQFEDLLLIEPHNTALGRYDILPYGTPHPNTERYSGYVLVLQRAVPGDEKWVMRYWARDPRVQNTWNLARQEFDAEDVTKEIFVRHYLVRREEYIGANIPAKLSTLTGVISIRVTAGGSGYDSTTTITLVPVGLDPGVGATASPIIFRGAVVGIYVTAEGSGYAVAPTVTITGPAGSSGAAATARLSPANAKLTQEFADRLEGQPRDGVYLRITRVYQTIPGATTTAKTFDEFGGLVTTTEQTVVATTTPTNTIDAGVPHIQSITPESTVIARLKDEARDISGLFVRDVENADPNVPGSRATIRYYLVDKAAQVPDDTATVTYERRRYPRDPNLQVEIKTTYQVPPDYVEDQEGSFAFPTLFEYAQIIRGTDFGIIWRRREGFSKLVVFKHYHSFSTIRGNVTPDAITLASWSLPFGFRDSALTPLNPANRTYIFTDAEGNELTAVIPLSSPSRDEYLGIIGSAWIGNEKIVGGSSTIWRAGIYKTTVIKVKFE